MKRIEVTISPKGETKIEAFGYVGDSCRAATKQLESSLGTCSSKSLKPEFYQSTESKIEQKEEQ